MNVRLATEAMGTRFELVLHGEDELFLRAAGEEAIQLIHEQHTRLSAFEPGSLVSRINTLAHQRPVPLDAELWDLLTLCAQVWQESGGAFDPAVGSLMRRWGFRGEPADEAGSDAAGERPSFSAVGLDSAHRSIVFRSPAVTLDFGAVAKGFAIDLVVAHLRDLGIERALIHGGTSTAAAIGTPPDQPGWLIQIAAPASAPPLTACLRDAALSVSSPMGRRAEAQGVEVGHIMDPRAGRPAGDRLLAGVAASSAALTDAWSTALVVLGGRPASMPTGLATAVLSDGYAWIIEPDNAGIFAVQA